MSEKVFFILSNFGNIDDKGISAKMATRSAFKLSPHFALK
ncbi:hypothetical protein SAMN04488511_11499 [Pedobacter suwonensis]|uniref:Uncharacterized protein n=1 Tax=Pedobacter suwonensis TaxID=332999 RepID=A0A1I0TTU9_9SPHI|nr:hypothetical protein SAMN04488511_11499 [Pedobacter suwonensis]